MKNVTLRQLKVFHTVAHHLSFSRAAEELHLTQPAVSAQVKELESHAGLALFERVGKKTFLTDRRCRAAGALPCDPAAAARGRRGAGAAEGRFRRAAQRRGDQRRRLFLSAAARGVHAAPSRGRDQPHRAQPRGTSAPARREPDRPGGDGASAGGHRRRARGVRAARVRDRRGAGASARRAAAHPARAHPARALHRARARLGHVDVDGRGVRRADARCRRRDGDPQQRDDQAGGDRRHGRARSCRSTRSCRTSSLAT